MLGFCKIVVKIFRSSQPPSVEVRSAVSRGGTMLIALGYTKRLSLGRQGELPIGQEKAPWGGCRACRGGEGFRCTFAIHTPFDCMLLYKLSLPSIQLISYAYRLQSPLSRPSGASSPQGEPLLSLTSIHLVYTQKTYLILIPIQSAKAPATFPPGEVAANHSKNSTPNTLNKRPSRCAHHRQHAHC